MSFPKLIIAYEDNDAISMNTKSSLAHFSHLFGKRMIIHVLGTAQDGGYPHAGCKDDCCVYVNFLYNAK